MRFGGFLLGVSLPAQQTERGAPVLWPRRGQAGVPAAVAWTALDERARSALREAGVVEPAQVGCPLTVHFARDVAAAMRPSIRCRVLRGEQTVPGVLVDYSASSPGCFAFVPLEPLAAGERIDVRWTAPTALLGAEEAIGEVSFRPE